MGRRLAAACALCAGLWSCLQPGRQLAKTLDPGIPQAFLADACAACSEEPPYGSDRKPEEMYHIIEHFAMGRRRLELFGEDHNVRPGWVTVGSSLSASNFSPQVRGLAPGASELPALTSQSWKRSLTVRSCLPEPPWRGMDLAPGATELREVDSSGRMRNSWPLRPVMQALHAQRRQLVQLPAMGPPTELTSSWLAQAYAGHFLLPDGTPYVGGSQRPMPGAPNLLGTSDEIENLRPKSPAGGRGG